MEQELIVSIKSLVDVLSQTRSGTSDNQILLTMNKLIDGIQAGFTRLDLRFDSFIKDYDAHKNFCADQLAKAKEEMAYKKGKEEAAAEAELKECKQGIDWGKVKTTTIGVVITILVLLLLGLLFPNVKWR